MRAKGAYWDGTSPIHNLLCDKDIQYHEVDRCPTRLPKCIFGGETSVAIICVHIDGDTRGDDTVTCWG